MHFSFSMSFINVKDMIASRCLDQLPPFAGFLVAVFCVVVICQVLFHSDDSVDVHLSRMIKSANYPRRNKALTYNNKTD